MHKPKPGLALGPSLRSGTSVLVKAAAMVPPVRSEHRTLEEQFLSLSGHIRELQEDIRRVALNGNLDRLERLSLLLVTKRERLAQLGKAITEREPQSTLITGDRKMLEPAYVGPIRPKDPRVAKALNKAKGRGRKRWAKH